MLLELLDGEEHQLGLPKEDVCKTFIVSSVEIHFRQVLDPSSGTFPLAILCAFLIFQYQYGKNAEHSFLPAYGSAAIL